MEQGQVVQVRGVRFGTGYLIAPRLVLTAAHVLAPDGEVTVSLPASATRCAAVVRWHGGDALDAALLEVTADDWVPPTTLRGALGRRPQRFGRCVTGGAEIPVAALGFPRQQRKDGVRDLEELVGRVRPHGGATVEILDDIGPLDTDDPTGTAWSGMSGAAVFAKGEKLLIGVVRADRQPRHGTRLTYLRAEDLLADTDFRAVVRDATGVDPIAEPVELAGLLEPAPPKEVGSPTMLLRADAEVVAFHGRADLLADLEQWCLANPDGPPAVRVVTGPGGQGKTRLARQLMTRLRAHGWVTGELHGEPADLRVLQTVQHPLLLVVDYAESRPELVRQLRRATEETRHPVRLLLLARSLGSWANKITGALSRTMLHALDPDDPDHAFRAAAQDLARHLAVVTGRTDVDWRGLADTIPVNRSGPGAETALTVQMAALVALLRRVPGRDQTSLEAELLERHERTYWLDTAAGRGLGDVDADRLEQAVAAAVLCPALDTAEARATMSRLGADESPWPAGKIAAWLRDLYPPPEGRYWGQLEPDRLGEYHAADHIVRDPDLLTRLFTDAPDHQRVQTLTVLARAAVAHANEGRAEAAHEVVDQLRAVLREPLTAAVLRAHTDTLPAQSHVLRDYALDVARELSRATDDDPADRAWAQHNLAERHLAVGHWTEAVAAARDAATIRERLADDGTMTHRREWADSLVVLSRALRRAGRLAESYAAGDRALDLFRVLAAEDGADWEERERGLVLALVNQSWVVWQLDPATISFDQIARSDEYTDEAVRRARDLADGFPDLDPLLLTDALAQRSTILSRLQRHPEALAGSEEAVRFARRLANENRDAYTADLARALTGLSADYYATHPSAEKSIVLELETIDLLRPLAADLPAVHLPSLARALHNLAWDRFDVGDHDGARVVLDEAVDHRRTLARGSHGTEMSELANTVRTLAVFAAAEGDHETAVARFEESRDLYARAGLPPSASDLRTQSGAALDLARSYAALGRTADALAAVTEAGLIRRRLSEYAPSLYLAGYAKSLRDLADLYHEQEREVPERIVLRHAVSLYRSLDDEANLAYCLLNLGESYATSWATARRAVAPLREAYELFATLSEDDEDYVSGLADTCMVLTIALLKTSRFPEAVPVAEHEVRLRRRLLLTGEEQALCFALLRLADSLTMAGRPAAAWRTAREAEEIGRELATRVYPVTRAMLLGLLADTLSRCGRHDLRRAARAVPYARRAVRLYRRMVDRNPKEHQNSLNWAVKTLATTLRRVGRHAEARDVELRKEA